MTAAAGLIAPISLQHSQRFFRFSRGKYQFLMDAKQDFTCEPESAPMQVDFDAHGPHLYGINDQCLCIDHFINEWRTGNKLCDQLIGHTYVHNPISYLGLAVQSRVKLTQD